MWVAADWRRRYSSAVSFLAAMTVLMGASEWYLPHWIPLFWHAVREYRRYTGSMSVLDSFDRRSLESRCRTSGGRSHAMGLLERAPASGELRRFCPHS